MVRLFRIPGKKVNIPVIMWSVVINGFGNTDIWSRHGCGYGYGYGYGQDMVVGILTYGQDTGGLKDVQLGPPPKENAPIIYKYKESAPGKDLI